MFFSLTSTQCQTISSFIVHLLSFFFFSYDLWLRPFTRPLSLSWQKPTISSSLKSSSNRSGQMHLRLALLVDFALLSLITLHHQALCATLAYICLSKCPRFSRLLNIIFLAAFRVVAYAVHLYRLHKL